MIRQGVKFGLFQAIDPQLFQMLARPTRERNALILEELFTQYFDEAMAELPRRADVLAIIRDAIQHMPQIDDSDMVQSPDNLAHAIYKDFIDTGWLREMRQGFTQVCEMPPAAHALINFLLRLNESLQRSYGADVQSIERNLSGAKDQPDRYATGLIAAADQSKSLIRHLRMIRSSLSGIEQELMTPEMNAATLLQRAVDGLVDRILITDFRALKTSNNPFSFRFKILEDLDALADSPTKLVRISQNLVEQGICRDTAAAEQAIWRSIDTIRAAFNDIGVHIDQIELYIYRLEKRIAVTANYLDSALFERELDIAGLMRELVTLDQRHPGVQVPSAIAPDPRPWDQTVLNPLRRVGDKPPVTKAHRRQLSERQLAYERSCTRYLDLFDTDPMERADEAVAVLRQLGQVEPDGWRRASVTAAEQIASADDIATVDGLRQLALTGPPEQPVMLAGGVRMRVDQAWVSSRWFTSRRIIVEQAADRDKGQP